MPYEDVILAYSDEWVRRTSLRQLIATQMPSRLRDAVPYEDVMLAFTDVRVRKTSLQS